MSPVPQPGTLPEPTPQQCRDRRLALGLSPDQAARRTGLPAEALLRFEDGGGGLTEEQVAVLVRALRAPDPREPPQRARPLLDLGLFGALAFFAVGAVPVAMALVSSVDAMRFIDSEWVEAEVIGVERRVRVVERQSGPSERIETVVPLLRYRPTGRDEITIPWRDSLPDEVELAEGDRIRLIIPRSAPRRAESSIGDVIMRPFFSAALAAPLIAIGAISLRHFRRRRLR